MLYKNNYVERFRRFVARYYSVRIYISYRVPNNGLDLG